MTFEHVGHDACGRKVYRAPMGFMLGTVLEYFLPFCADAPQGLLWNGVHTVAYPGMNAVEFLTSMEMRRAAHRAKQWPAQVMPFAPEFDPFKITLLPTTTETP